MHFVAAEMSFVTSPIDLMKTTLTLFIVLLLAPLNGLAVDEAATKRVLSSAPVADRHPDDRTDWFMQAKYRVMMHFGVGPHNVALVDKFDVERLAEQLQEAGAGYFMLMLGQHSGCYAAPNAAYDEITSSSPGEKCSIRDLPLELYRALHPRGIKLMLYLPANPPDVPEIRRQFGWDSQVEAGRPTPKRGNNNLSLCIPRLLPPLGSTAP